MTDRDFFGALKALQPSNSPSLMVTPTVNPIGGDVCSVYKQVRPLLVGVLPILKAIPIFGPQLADVIQTLITATDAFCKDAGGAPLPAPRSAQEIAFLAAVEAFHPAGPAALADAPGVSSPSDFCKTYKGIKPVLQGILPFLGLIPGYGAAVVAGITALIGVLDHVCP